MRNDKRVIPLFILMVTAFYHCTFNGHQGWNEQDGAPGKTTWEAIKPCLWPSMPTFWFSGFV
jgi:hypothetical protein